MIKMKKKHIFADVEVPYKHNWYNMHMWQTQIPSWKFCGLPLLMIQLIIPRHTI